DEPPEKRCQHVEKNAHDRPIHFYRKHRLGQLRLREFRVVVQVSQAADMRLAISAYSTIAAHRSATSPAREASAKTPVGNGINAAVPMMPRLIQFVARSTLERRSNR